eukprot:6325879-Karenia_brevis.AAC.1
MVVVMMMTMMMMMMLMVRRGTPPRLWNIMEAGLSVGRSGLTPQVGFNGVPQHGAPPRPPWKNAGADPKVAWVVYHTV